jgi:16S rRNA (guanine527-N7)-methyltransferase
MSISASEASFRKLLATEWPGLTERQLIGLAQHYDLMLRWNVRLNLTRVSKLEEAVRFHYGESLFLAETLPPGPLRIVDIGSGAGFPGIPVAVARPECTVDLVESDLRKAVFLREATHSISNIAVIAKRAEECEPNYDWIVSRAVAPGKVLTLGLAPEAALLLSEDDALSAFKIHKIPWGERRVVGLFHVEQRLK